MKALYISIQARFLCTLTVLLVVSVLVLCAASWSMTGRILGNMRIVNLDIESRRVVIEIQRRLLSSFSLIFQVSVAPGVQNITMGLPTVVTSEDAEVLDESLAAFNISDIRLYGPDTNLLGELNFGAQGLNQSLATTLFPLEDPATIQHSVYQLTTQGLASSIPISLGDPQNMSEYVISLTIPILLESSLETVLTSPYDLVNKTDAPTIGFLAGLFEFLSGGPIEVDDNLFVVLAQFNEDQPVITVVAPLANLANCGMKTFTYGENITLDTPLWENVVTSSDATTRRSKNGAIVSVAPLSAPYDEFVIYMEEDYEVMRDFREPLLKALIIAGCVSCLIGFLVLFGLNRWRTRNLVNLIDTTGKRKKALDDSRKKVEAGKGGPGAEPILGDGASPDQTRCDSIQHQSEPSSAITIGGDGYATDCKTSSSSWPSWIKRRKSPKQENEDHESGPKTLMATSYKHSKSFLPIHIKDEAVDMSMGIDSIFEALVHQYKILEDRVQERKAEIAEAKHNADEANAAKSHFLARVTHELRTPLNGILGTASLCMDEQDLPQIHVSLKTIYKCGELLLHLLTDLLSFSQSETETVELDEQEFTIEEITTQIIAIFREQTAINRITMDIKIDPDCEREIVSGDINRILQVIFNLLSNSIKFTPQGGHIEFNVTAQPLDNGTKRMVSCVVRDDGPGIAPHLQDRVFEAFVQGDINSKVRKAGVGLGLSICKQLAHRMGGSISLKSKLGEGAEFTFNVPLKYVGHAVNDCSSTSSRDGNFWPEYEHYNTSTIMRKAEAELGVSRKHSNMSGSTPSSGHQSFDFQRQNGSEPSMTPSIDERVDASSGSDRASLRPPLQRGVSLRGSTVDPSLRVLIADDNKVNQEVMIRMLNLEGLHDITVADDGLEAIEKTRIAQADGTLFDIIFMDVQMPNCDGKRATQILREKDIKIPIIAVSAYASEENVEACIEAGMNLFLGKPLRRPSLHKLLEGLQDSKFFETSGIQNEGLNSPV